MNAKTPTDSRLTYLIKRIHEITKSTPFEGHVYLASSCLRNAYLSLPPKNIEIVVDVPHGGIPFASMLAMAEGCFRSDGTNPYAFPNMQMAMLSLGEKNELFKGTIIFCSQTRKDAYRLTSPDYAFGTLSEDAVSRDFTIDSLYYKISDGKVYSIKGNGSKDIAKRIIRTTTTADFVFRRHPIRMLRAIRLSCTLGFGIEKDTWLSIVKNANKINVIDSSCLHGEITQILLSPKPSVGITKMLFSGLLEYVLPDIYDLQEAYESRNPLITSFSHTLDVLDETQPNIETRFAALFHDVANIVSNSSLSHNTALNKDEFSADVAVSELKRLDFSDEICQSVKNIILHHRFFKLYANSSIPDRKVKKFMSACGEDLYHTLDLMQANNLHSVYSKAPRQVQNVLKQIERIQKENKEKESKIPINGNDIMAELHVKKGKHIGAMLNAVKKAYASNPQMSKEECLQVASQKLSELAT